MITAMAIQASIQSGQSENTMELSLYNPSTRNRGGSLTLPLPPGAVLMGYSLEVEGVMIDGVVVEQARASQVYTTLEHRGVDPGLVEQAQGNVFRTRVFPIGPGKTRRITIRWTCPLEGPEARIWRMPLSLKRPVDRFSADIFCAGDSRPKTSKTGGLQGLEFTSWQAGWRSQTEKTRFQAEGELEITIPQSGLDRPLVQHSAGADWFSVLIRPENHPPGAARWTKAALPRVMLYLDASLSQSKTDSRLVAWALGECARVLGKEIRVDVTLFRDSPEYLGSYTVSSQNTNALVRALGSVQYDGGSRFDTLPAPPEGSLALVCTDALATLGETLPDWPQGERVILLSPGARDSGAAARLGGPMGQVIEPRHSMAELSALIVGQAAGLSLKAEAGLVEDLHSLELSPGLFLVAGRLVDNQARIRWNLGAAQGTLDIQAEGESPNPQGQASPGELARFAWAQTHLAWLLQSPDHGSQSWKARVKAFGLEHGIVTPGTSFLVLENLDQYIEFNIPPPASLPQWRKTWLAHQSQEERDEKIARDSRINNLAQQWKERLAWWNTDYSKVPDKVNLPSAGKADFADSPRGGDLRRSSENDHMALDLAMEAPATSNGAAPAAPAPQAEGAEMKKELEEASPQAPPLESRLAIRSWTPDRPYLKQLEGLAVDGAYRRYLGIRDEWQASPAFFLECGDWFARNGRPDLASRIWTSIADLGYRDSQFLRILAMRLQDAGSFDLSIKILQTVLELKPYEAQSHRDLGLALVQAGRYAQGLPMLYTVCTGKWERTRGIELIALMEFNQYLAQAREKARSDQALAKALASLELDPRLAGLPDCDLRIVLSWDADMTDMDLWITEPSGFKVHYAAKDSPHGGHISNDITDGYGPEEYLIRRARAGMYKVECNYYGSGSPELSGPVTLHALVTSNWGRPDAKRQVLTLQLDAGGAVFYIGDVTWQTAHR